MYGKSTPSAEVTSIKAGRGWGPSVDLAGGCAGGAPLRMTSKPSLSRKPIRAAYYSVISVLRSLRVGQALRHDAWSDSNARWLKFNRATRLRRTSKKDSKAVP